MARPRYRPRYRRNRRSRKTASPVVKLTSEITWTNFAQQSGQARRYSPFYFAPTQLPGFPDYQLTYSQFRILKCKLQLSLASEGVMSTTISSPPVAHSPVTWVLVV